MGLTFHSFMGLHIVINPSTAQSQRIKKIKAYFICLQYFLIKLYFT